MASKAGGKLPAAGTRSKRTAVVDEKKKKVEKKEGERVLLIPHSKGDKRRSTACVQKKVTKPTQTEQPKMISQQSRRQTKGNRTEQDKHGKSDVLQVTEQPRAPTARRVLKDSAVNVNYNKHSRKPPMKLGSRPPPPPTADIHTSTNSTADAAKKVVPTSIDVPEIAAKAVQCPESGSSTAKEQQPPDPDLGTEDDPQLCAEYVKDIYKNLLELEKRSVYLIKENFLSHQVEVGKYQRAVLVDWLVQVHERFLLVPETLHLTVDILDRSLQACVVTKDDLQLVGVTAMLLASKYEDMYPPTIGEFAYIAADTYSPQRICKMELPILKQLDYQLSNPSVMLFLRRYSKLMSTDKRVHNLAKYILEQSLLEPTNSSIPNSKKAGGALLLAAAMLNPSEPLHKLWCDTLVVYSSYEVSHLEEVKQKLEISLYKGHHHERFNAIREKYAHKEFLKVSTLAILDKESNPC